MGQGGGAGDGGGGGEVSNQMNILIVSASSESSLPCLIPCKNSYQYFLSCMMVHCCYKGFLF